MYTIFSNIYIYTKEDKNRKLYYMVLAIICNIISRIWVMAQKIHMYWRPKYYGNLFCESKLLTEVDPKKDEVSSYKQAWKIQNRQTAFYIY